MATFSDSDEKLRKVLLSDQLVTEPPFDLNYIYLFKFLPFGDVLSAVPGIVVFMGTQRLSPSVRGN